MRRRYAIRPVPRHLRWQLVVGFALTVALLLASLTVTERFLLERSLVQTVDQSIEATIQHQVVDGYERKLQDANRAAEIAKVTSNLGAMAQGLATQDQPVVLLDMRGNVLADAGSLSQDHAPAHPLFNSVAQALTRVARVHVAGIDRAWTGQVTTREGDFQLVLWPTHVPVATGQIGLSLRGRSKAGLEKSPGTLRVPTHVHTSYLVVAVAHSVHDSEATVQTATTISLVGGLLAVGIAIMLGLLIVQVALRPLAAITTGAEQLARGDYDHRLAVTPGTDEIGRLATAFNRMAGAIAAAFALQRRFVADASHELRTPLTALRGYTDVLQLGVVGDRETTERVLDAMQDDLGRMTRLVDDLLSLARSNAGASTQRDRVAVAELLQSAARDGSALSQGAQYIQVDPVSPDLIVEGDRDRLRQVLSNVVANACAYSPQQSTVVLRAERGEGWVAMTVQDNGPGIPASELSRIGEPFYRGDATRTRSTGGTGLGLAIARSMVENHGGTLSIESTVGIGTSVTICLPCTALAPSSLGVDRHR